MDPIIDLTIDAIGAAGDGLARDGDRRVAVPGALPGERVRARLVPSARGPAVAREVVILDPSPARQAPPCAHFSACGGCVAQHMAPALYGGWKMQMLLETLARARVATPSPEPLVVTPPGSRRRAEFAGLGARGGAVVGFHGRGAARIEPIDVCAVLRPELVGLLPALRDLVHALLLTRAECDIAAQLSDGEIDLTLTLRTPPDFAQRERIVAIARSAGIARLSWRRGRDDDPEIVVQARPVRAQFSGVSVDLPPDAFLQASVDGEAAIVARVQAYAAGTRNLADLYAGCGTLTFALGAAVRVHAVEGRKAATDALRVAARRAGRTRITAETRDLARRPLLPGELSAFDAVIFDPPRAGATAQAAELARGGPPLVVAVSCNPASFARDAAILVGGGYRLTALAPIDQFLWSSHLELVAAFRR